MNKTTIKKTCATAMVPSYPSNNDWFSFNLAQGFAAKGLFTLDILSLPIEFGKGSTDIPGHCEEELNHHGETLKNRSYLDAIRIRGGGAEPNPNNRKGLCILESSSDEDSSEDSGSIGIRGGEEDEFVEDRFRYGGPDLPVMADRQAFQEQIAKCFKFGSKAIITLKKQGLKFHKLGMLDCCGVLVVRNMTQDYKAQCTITELDDYTVFFERELCAPYAYLPDVVIRAFLFRDYMCWVKKFNDSVNQLQLDEETRNDGKRIIMESWERDNCVGFFVNNQASSHFHGVLKVSKHMKNGVIVAVHMDSNNERPMEITNFDRYLDLTIKFNDMIVMLMKKEQDLEVPKDLGELAGVSEQEERKAEEIDPYWAEFLGCGVFGPDLPEMANRLEFKEQIAQCGQYGSEVITTLMDKGLVFCEQGLGNFCAIRVVQHLCQDFFDECTKEEMDGYSRGIGEPLQEHGNYVLDPLIMAFHKRGFQTLALHCWNTDMDPKRLEAKKFWAREKLYQEFVKDNFHGFFVCGTRSMHYHGVLKVKGTNYIGDEEVVAVHLDSTDTHDGWEGPMQIYEFEKYLDLTIKFNDMVVAVYRTRPDQEWAVDTELEGLDGLSVGHEEQGDMELEEMEDIPPIQGPIRDDDSVSLPGEDGELTDWFIEGCTTSDGQEMFVQLFQIPGPVEEAPFRFFNSDAIKLANFAKDRERIQKRNELYARMSLVRAARADDRLQYLRVHEPAQYEEIIREHDAERQQAYLWDEVILRGKESFRRANEAWLIKLAEDAPRRIAREIAIGRHFRASRIKYHRRMKARLFEIKMEKNCYANNIPSLAQYPEGELPPLEPNELYLGHPMIKNQFYNFTKQSIKVTEEWAKELNGTIGALSDYSDAEENDESEDDDPLSSSSEHEGTKSAREEEEVEEEEDDDISDVPSDVAPEPSPRDASDAIQSITTSEFTSLPDCDYMRIVLENTREFYETVQSQCAGNEFANIACEQIFNRKFQKYCGSGSVVRQHSKNTGLKTLQKRFSVSNKANAQMVPSYVRSTETVLSIGTMEMAVSPHTWKQGDKELHDYAEGEQSVYDIVQYLKDNHVPGVKLDSKWESSHKVLAPGCLQNIHFDLQTQNRAVCSSWPKHISMITGSGGQLEITELRDGPYNDIWEWIESLRDPESIFAQTGCKVAVVRMDLAWETKPFKYPAVYRTIGHGVNTAAIFSNQARYLGHARVNREKYSLFNGHKHDGGITLTFPNHHLAESPSSVSKIKFYHECAHIVRTVKPIQNPNMSFLALTGLPVYKVMASVYLLLGFLHTLADIMLRVGMVLRAEATSVSFYGTGDQETDVHYSQENQRLKYGTRQQHFQSVRWANHHFIHGNFNIEIVKEDECTSLAEMFLRSYKYVDALQMELRRRSTELVRNCVPKGSGDHYIRYLYANLFACCGVSGSSIYNEVHRYLRAPAGTFYDPMGILFLQEYKKDNVIMISPDNTMDFLLDDGMIPTNGGRDLLLLENKERYIAGFDDADQAYYYNQILFDPVSKEWLLPRLREVFFTLSAQLSQALRDASIDKANTLKFLKPLYASQRQFMTRIPGIDDAMIDSTANQILLVATPKFYGQSSGVKNARAIKNHITRVPEFGTADEIAYLAGAAALRDRDHAGIDGGTSMLEDVDDDDAIIVVHSPAWCELMGNAIIGTQCAFEPIFYKKKSSGVKVNLINDRSAMKGMPEKARTILRALHQNLENKKKMKELASLLNIQARDIWTRRGGFLAIDIFHRICECYATRVHRIFDIQGQVLFQLGIEENHLGVGGFGPDGTVSRENLDQIQQEHMEQQDRASADARAVTDRRRQARANDEKAKRLIVAGEEDKRRQREDTEEQISEEEDSGESE